MHVLLVQNKFLHVNHLMVGHVMEDFDGVRWNVRRAISITHMQSVAISCNHLFIERMSGHCIG